MTPDPGPSACQAVVRGSALGYYSQTRTKRLVEKAHPGQREGRHGHAWIVYKRKLCTRAYSTHQIQNTSEALVPASVRGSSCEEQRQ